MYSFFRFFLFLFSPEKAHKLSSILLKLIIKFPFVKNFLKKYFCTHSPLTEVNIANLKFSNPIGLAAGFDKNADLFPIFQHFGFSFIEIGTVTPKPQNGNEKPRLFRLVKDKALINRMGFNNDGAKIIAQRLKKLKKNSNIIIGGNIGKNKVTENENALNDYLICFEELFPFVDYFVVNVSSPNTPNLRQLQDKEPLKNILSELMKKNEIKKDKKPIFLKIAPDLNTEQLDDIIEIIEETKIQGIVATNTSIQRNNLITEKEIIDSIGNGGLSGKPIRLMSTEIIRYIKNKQKKPFTIIGVGGIHCVEDALEKLDAGADLIQLYTGFIYEGPALIKKINLELIKKKENERV
ncbi:MAG: quinone-dependent dihydroorotate dehydrogenase [Flavobacteriia bacterium]|nr:quinone-dependent dihydroorotate dehydrogenase [Flavobacteriia bacterium]